MIKLLDKSNLFIGEIAKILAIPQSSAAFHLKLLEKAGQMCIRDRGRYQCTYPVTGRNW